MKPLIQFKQTPIILTILTLLCSGISPVARAVSPSPDGCYPGLTTAEGCNALFSLTTGQGNTAIGHDALFSDMIGSWNTSVGAVALGFNDGDFNTAVGTAALLLNTTGAQNTAVGAIALVNNDTGSANTAIGDAALFNNTSGNDNTANGDGALVNNDTGEGNVAIGSQALHSNSEGFSNTAVGGGALFNSTGTGNIAIGFNAGNNVSTASSVICIGAPGQDVSTSCYIGNIFNVTSSGGTAVFINSDGKLGTTTSSKRFKEQIRPMDKASEKLFSLKPVTFRYKKEVDPADISQLGLIAEDVARVNADLVVRDKEGKPYSVRYDQVNAMLLNEFLKEHRKVQEHGATITRLERRIEALTAGLQKVSAQLEVSKASPQTVVNNH